MRKTLPEAHKGQPTLVIDAPDVRGSWPAFVLLTVAVLLVVVAAFNAAVNARGDFPGRAAAPSSEYEAVHKMWLLQAYADPPGTIVVGSSRLQTWAPVEVAAQGNGSAFNFAVAGTRPTDHVVLYQELERRGLRPDELWVGVDVEAWNDPPYTPSRMASLTKLDRPVPWTDEVRFAVQSLDHRYVEDSVQALLHPEGPQADPDRTWFEPDGLGHYGPWERQLADGSYDQSRYVDKYRNMTDLWTDHHPHPRQVEATQDLARMARENGTRTTFVLTPVHPVRLAAEGPVFDEFRGEVLAVLQDLCSPTVRIVDLSDPATLGETGEGFYDTQHATPALAHRIVEAVATQPDLCG